MSIKFNYYYGKEAEQFSFFRIPKLLFTDKNFSTLSSDAKVLYGILLDRMSLSMKNGWLDEENKVYIIFTIEEISEIIGCGTQKATKILQELDTAKGIGLVEKKRLGLGKPNVLYIKNFIVENSEDVLTTLLEKPDEENTTKQDDFTRGEEITEQELLKPQLQNCENHNSRNVNFTKQELLKSPCNKTNINNTEYSYTDFNNISPISPSEDTKENLISQGQYVEEELIEILKQNMDYDFLVEEQVKEKGKIDLIVNLMTEMIIGKAEVRINQSVKSYEAVKEKFLSLRKEHIEYVLLVLRENKQRIVNLRAYLLSLLYNAPVNILQVTDNSKIDVMDYSRDQQIWQEFLDTT